MSREQIGALLQLMQPSRPVHSTMLDSAKAAMCQYCSEWYTDLSISHNRDKKKLDADEEYKAIQRLVMEQIHGMNSVRFLKEDAAKTLWRMVAASPTMFNFVHAATSYLSNQIATNDDKGWAALVDEIKRAESALSDSKGFDDASRNENLDLLPNMTDVGNLLKDYPWMVTLYVIFRCRYTQLFREV